MDVFFHPQDWKTGKGQMATLTPKFIAEADLSDISQPKPPALKLCQLSSSGALTIPKNVREKWLADPVRRFLVIVFKSSCFHSKHMIFQNPDWTH